MIQVILKFFVIFYALKIIAPRAMCINHASK